MHRTTLMIPKVLWAEIAACAAEQGVSASQFVRESALAAVYFHRGDHPPSLPFHRALVRARAELAGGRSPTVQS